MKLWSLQVLRFFAALLVVHIHAVTLARDVAGGPGLVGAYGIIGRCGVDIFFVISGVIIARTAAGLSPQAFALKRFRRVVPLYLLFALPMVIKHALVDGFTWRDALATFALWPATDVMTAPALDVAWTLSFEMLFYAAATLVLVDRRWAYVLVAAWAAAMALDGPLFQFVGNPIIAEFLFGVALARAPRWRLGPWLIPLGVACLIAGIRLLPSGDTLRFLEGSDWERPLVLGLPAAMIVYGVMQIDAKPSAWTYLGEASYSLYLSHGLALIGVYVLAKAIPMPPDVFIVLALGVAVAVSCRIHEAFEKPLMKLRLPGLRSPPAATGATSSAPGHAGELALSRSVRVGP